MGLPPPSSCTSIHTAPLRKTLPQAGPQATPQPPPLTPSWPSSRPGPYQAGYPRPGPVHESHLCWAPQTPLSPPQTNGVLTETLG